MVKNQAAKTLTEDVWDAGELQHVTGVVEPRVGGASIEIKNKLHPNVTHGRQN